MDRVLVVETVPARRAVEIPQVIEDEVSVGGKAVEGRRALFPGLPVGQEGLTFASGMDKLAVVAGYDVRVSGGPSTLSRMGMRKTFPWASYRGTKSGS